MAENNNIKTPKALIVGPEWLTEIKNPMIIVVSTYDALLKSINQSLVDNDLLRIFIPGQFLKPLINSGVHDLAHVDSIYIYFDSLSDYQSNVRMNQGINDKLHFLMTTDLLTEISAAISPYFTSGTDASRASMSKSTPSRRKKTKKSKGIVVANAVSIDINCHKCSLKFDEPFQLDCGHRQCKSCIDKQEG